MSEFPYQAEIPALEEFDLEQQEQFEASVDIDPGTVATDHDIQTGIEPTAEGNDDGKVQQEQDTPERAAQRALDIADLDAMKQGNTQGAANIYERYHPFLTKFAARLTGDREAAAEIVQDVFVKFLDKEFDPEKTSTDPYVKGGVPGMLVSMTRFTAYDAIRYDRRRPVKADSEKVNDIDVGINMEHSGLTPNPEQAVVDDDLSDTLLAAIGNLKSADQRAIVFGRFFQEKTPSEIATELDTSPGAVRVAQHRALGTLGTRLAEVLAEPPRDAKAS